MTGKQFIEWWFNKCEQQPVIWECQPGNFGSGQTRTLQQYEFISFQNSDIYFRATTVDVVPKVGRGGSKLAGEIAGFWLDIDFCEGVAKSDRYPMRSQVEDLMHELPDPSAVVETGGGLHCYWKLKTPLRTLDSGNILECWHNITNNIWQSNGFLLDNVSNPDRELRMPGSINWKQKKFETTCAVNDLTYTVEDLIGACDAPETVSNLGWYDKPTLQTAYDEVIDAQKIWLDQGFTKSGSRSNPDGTFFLRPNSGSSKSVTVWDDTGISTIHSSVVLDKLELANQHISGFMLADKLDVLDRFKDEAEARLEVLKKSFNNDLGEARKGGNVSESRWFEAVTYHLLEERLTGLRPGKESLVRDFPAQFLPEDIRSACEIVATDVGAPVEMVYPVGLGAVAGAVQGRTRLDVYDTPVSLYMLVAAASGSGKSGIINSLTRGLHDLDGELIKKWQPHKTRFIKEYNDLQDKVVKKKQAGENVDRLEKLFIKARADTVSPNVILGKLTPAALYEHLALRKSVTVSTSEGADWLNNFRDSNSSDVSGDALLELYDGHVVRKSTKKDGLLYVDGTLTILLMSQSANLDRFSNLHKSGLWQRFLYVDLPEKTPVHRKPKGLDTFPVDVFNKNLRDLYMSELPEKVTVSDEAATIFYEWEYFTKRRGNEHHPDVFDERYSDQRLYEAVSKSHSHALRIAGLLTVWQSRECLQGVMVGVEEMRAGIAISSWFYDRRVADSLVDVYDSADERLSAVMDFIRSEGKVTATWMNRQTPYFNDSKSAKLYLDSLVSKGVLDNSVRVNIYVESKQHT